MARQGMTKQHAWETLQVYHHKLSCPIKIQHCPHFRLYTWKPEHFKLVITSQSLSWSTRNCTSCYPNKVEEERFTAHKGAQCLYEGEGGL